jgi:hypothetical protein
MIAWPADRAGQVLSGYRTLTESPPQELTSYRAGRLCALGARRE